MPYQTTSSTPAEQAQQYFPTYKVSSIEIASKEYELSAQSLVADQRAISLAAGALVLIGGALTSVIASDNGLSALTSLTKSSSNVSEALYYVIVVALNCIAMLYLVELQKSATHSARKIVILRRLQGVDYGNIEKVLPSDRLEGANEPFAISLFPGWRTPVSLAALLVSGLTGYITYALVLTFSVNPRSLTSIGINHMETVGLSASMIVPILVTSVFLLAYRVCLFESWENTRFIIGRLLGALFDIPLKKRMGYVLYRMELAVYEAERLGFDLTKFYETLVFIEDKHFYNHNGNSILSVFKACFRYTRYRFVGGASTIAQQLCRSALLSVIPRDPRRKLIEWTLAPWLGERYAKSHILSLYLCSVRFARGVQGVPAAAQYYFGVKLHHASPWNPTKAQIFFLIERLSNVSGSFPTKRVSALYNNCVDAGILEQSDRSDIEDVYNVAILKGLVKKPDIFPVMLETRQGSLPSVPA